MTVVTPTYTRNYKETGILTSIQLGENFAKFLEKITETILRFRSKERKTKSYYSIDLIVEDMMKSSELQAKYPILTLITPDILNQSKNSRNLVAVLDPSRSPLKRFLTECDKRISNVSMFYPLSTVRYLSFFSWVALNLKLAEPIQNKTIDDLPYPEVPSVYGITFTRTPDTLETVILDDFVDIVTLRATEKVVAPSSAGPSQSGQDTTDYKVFDSAQRFSTSILDTIFSYAKSSLQTQADLITFLVNLARIFNEKIRKLEKEGSAVFCEVFDKPGKKEALGIQEIGGTRGGTSAGVGPVVYSKTEDFSKVIQGNVDQLDVSLPLEGSFVPVNVKIIGKKVSKEANFIQKQNFVHVQQNYQGIPINTAVTGVPYGSLLDKNGRVVTTSQYFRIVSKNSAGQYLWGDSSPVDRYTYDKTSGSYTLLNSSVNNSDIIYLDKWDPPFSADSNICSINLGDPSHEVFVSTVIGNYYDEGLLPFVNKFYGYFICPPDKSYVISARTSFDFTKMLSAVDCRVAAGGQMQATPNTSYIGRWKLPDTVSDMKTGYRNILLGLITQAAFTLDFLKEKLYLSHYDCWNNNLMVTYTHNKLISILDQTVIPTVYQGKSLDNVKWFDIRISDPLKKESRKRLLVQNMGLLFKLIDFGQSSIKFKFPEGKVFDVNHQGGFNGGDRARDMVSGNQSAFNSMELVYILVNIFDDYTKNQGFSESDPVVQMIFLLLAGVTDSSTGLQVIDILRSNTKTYTSTNPVTRGYIISDDGKAYLNTSLIPCHNPDASGKITSLAYPDPASQYLISGMQVKRRDIADKSNFQSFNSWWDRIFDLLDALGMKTIISEEFVDSYGNPEVYEETVYYISLDGTIPTNPYVEETILLGTNGSVVSKNPIKTPFLNYFDNKRTVSSVCDNPSVNAAQTKKYLQTNIRGLDSSVEKIDPSSDDAKSKICRDAETYNVTPNSPELIMEKMIVGDNPLSVYKSDGTLNQEVLANTLAGRLPSLPFHKVVGNLACFTLSVTPALTPMTGISSPGGLNLVKYPYQEWFNYEAPPGVGGYINAVRIHVNKISSPKGYLALNDSLLGVCQKLFDTNPSDNAFFTNGGYFIVSYNVKDPLNAGKVTNTDIGSPIGYTFTKDGGGKIVLDTPYPYKKDMGTVVFGKDGGVRIFPTLEFEGMHVQENTNMNIQLMSGQIISTQVPAIKVGEGYPRLKDGTDLFYDYAFTSGPILVKDGKVVFTRDKMMKSQFIVKNNSLVMEESEIFYPMEAQFKVTSYAKTNSAYRANYGQTDKDTDLVFPWGQRHSNQFIIHNVLATLEDGSVVTFLVEGRGFDGVGVDRTQLAEIVSLFGVKDAVSLDGGFSAQGLVASEEGAHYILNDPDKRKVGVVLGFIV